MSSVTRYNSAIKAALLFVGVLLFRLIPFRAPNLEPVLAAQMPIAKKMGGLSAFFFAFLSIVIYDMLTVGLGAWTFVTAIVYGALGLWAMRYFKTRTASRKHFVLFALYSTLVYDALTGLTIGPLFFHQSFMNAVTGQFVFTALHLAGNLALAAFVSPIIYRALSSSSVVILSTDAPTLRTIEE